MGLVNQICARVSPTAVFSGNQGEEMEKTRENLIGTGWNCSQLVYAVFIGLLLLGYQAIQIFDHEAVSFPAVLAAFRIGAAIVGIILGKLWKDKGFLIIFILLFYQTIQIALKQSGLFFSDSVSTELLNGLWAIGGCYAIGRILSRERIREFLHVFVIAWLALMAVQCLVALYAAWTDQPISNLSGGSIWGIPHSKNGAGYPERLRIGYESPTLSGSALSVSAIMALCALLSEKRKEIRILHCIAFIIVFVALGLTNARTSILSLSVGAALITFLSILEMRNKKGKESAEAIEKKKTIWTWAAAVVCMVAVLALSVFISLKIPVLFGEAKMKGNLVVTSAKAEETTSEEPWNQTIQSRDFTGSRILTGRDEVWQKVIQYLMEKPQRFIFGESIYNPMTGPNMQFRKPMGHCHNMVLQILLENGLVGLLIVLVFTSYTTRNAFRIVTSKTSSLWLKLIPVIPVSILVGDLAECFGWFHEWKGPALPFLFVACGIINAVGSKQKSPEDTNGIHQLYPE